MNGYPCRCRKCQARKTLAQLPEWYTDEQIPKCDCGGTYRVDNYRKKKEHKLTACYCTGYSWSLTNGPHRRGSRLCYDNPNYIKHIEEEMYGTH